MKVSKKEFSVTEQEYINSVIDQIVWKKSVSSKCLGVSFNEGVGHLPDGRKVLSFYHSDPNMGGYGKTIIYPLFEGVEWSRDRRAYIIPSEIEWELPHLFPQIRVS